MAVTLHWNQLIPPPPPPPPPPPVCFSLPHNQARLEELSELWQQLLKTSGDKRQKLQDAQKREQFTREADEVAVWISDREAVASSEEFGKDLEHVELLQKNFADFLKVGDSA